MEKYTREYWKRILEINETNPEDLSDRVKDIINRHYKFIKAFVDGKNLIARLHVPALPVLVSDKCSFDNPGSYEIKKEYRPIETVEEGYKYWLGKTVKHNISETEFDIDGFYIDVDGDLFVVLWIADGDNNYMDDYEVISGWNLFNNHKTVDDRIIGIEK